MTIGIRKYPIVILLSFAIVIDCWLIMNRLSLKYDNDNKK